MGCMGQTDAAQPVCFGYCAPSSCHIGRDYSVLNTGSNSPPSNGMHGMVTIVIEVDQKEILDYGQQCGPK